MPGTAQRPFGKGWGGARSAIRIRESKLTCKKRKGNASGAGVSFNSAKDYRGLGVVGWAGYSAACSFLPLPRWLLQLATARTRPGRGARWPKEPRLVAIPRP